MVRRRHACCPPSQTAVGRRRRAHNTNHTKRGGGLFPLLCRGRRFVFPVHVRGGSGVACMVSKLPLVGGMKARLIIEPSDGGWLDQPERPTTPFGITRTPPHAADSRRRRHAPPLKWGAPRDRSSYSVSPGGSCRVVSCPNESAAARAPLPLPLPPPPPTATRSIGQAPIGLQPCHCPKRGRHHRIASHPAFDIRYRYRYRSIESGSHPFVNPNPPPAGRAHARRCSSPHALHSRDAMRLLAACYRPNAPASAVAASDDARRAVASGGGVGYGTIADDPHKCKTAAAACCSDAVHSQPARRRIALWGCGPVSCIVVVCGEYQYDIKSERRAKKGKRGVAQVRSNKGSPRARSDRTNGARGRSTARGVPVYRSCRVQAGQQIKADGGFDLLDIYIEPGCGCVHPAPPADISVSPSPSRPCIPRPPASLFRRLLRGGYDRGRHTHRETWGPCKKALGIGTLLVHATTPQHTIVERATRPRVHTGRAFVGKGVPGPSAGGPCEP